jgi:hypothetical protein
MTRGLIGSVILVGAAAFGAAGDEPRWLNDYPEALRVARASGKPIFLTFRCER